MVAASTLAIFVVVFVMVPFSRTPTGYSVVAASACGWRSSSRMPLVHVSKTGDAKLGFDLSARQLAGALSEIYWGRAERMLYLSADSDATFQTVAEVIDVTHNLESQQERLKSSELKRSAPMSVEVRLVTTKSMNASCPSE